jgi:hypothetical protein
LQLAHLVGDEAQEGMNLLAVVATQGHEELAVLDLLGRHPLPSLAELARLDEAV